MGAAPQREFARRTACGLVFGIGCFGLAAQTLLFRAFLGVCEGNELAIGWFFAAWLLWVAVGAAAARGRGRLIEALAARVDLLCLLYLPAYALQATLIAHAREWAGVQAYELFPIARLLPAAFLANAPVSFCTGFVFALACGWLSSAGGSPVARVYIAEAVGGCAGGVGVTLLLARGWPEEAVLAAAVLLLVSLFALYRLARRSWVTAVLPLLLAAAAIVTGGPRRWEQANDRLAWERLLPREAYRGSLATPQARYRYGEYQGQFTVAAWESIVETLPNTEAAAQVAAVHLAQNPAARRFLVMGPGALAICQRFLALPRTEAVTWLDPDPDYPPQLLRVLPARLAGDMGRLRMPHADIRRYLGTTTDRYDAIVLYLPDVATLALNRYVTREFLQLARRRLAVGGVLGVRVAGVANVLGDERLTAGASVYDTLGRVFARRALKPGDETWLLASDGDGLSESPAVLRDRFRAIPGAAAIYPPDGLLSLFAPDRIAFQTDGYRAAIAARPPGGLLNTDRHPRALAQSLLLAAREAGVSPRLAAAPRRFERYGLPVVPAAIALYALLRLVYVRRRPGGTAADAVSGRVFDDGFLVFATGAVGMAASMVLMFMYQSAFGTLFLHVGLASALFMLGLSAGSAASTRVLSARGAAAAWLLPSALVAELGLLAAIGFLPLDAPRLAYAALFALAGLLGGVYVPVAAASLRRAAVSDRAAGARVEWSDHLGGAVGGLVAGLVLLPMFGSRYTLLVAGLLLAVNLVPLAWRERQGGAVAGRAVRPVGYTLFGVAAFLLAVALCLRRPGAGDWGEAWRQAARDMAGDAHVAPGTHVLESGVRLDYFTLSDAGGQVDGYLFGTEQLAPHVAGYGGPVVLAVRVDREGVLRDFRLLRSGETPAYVDRLAAWFRALIGGGLFESRPLAGVDAVTGATVTSAAVLRALREAGAGFARQVLGRSVETAAPAARPVWAQPQLALLAALAVAALLLRRRPSRRARWAVMALAVAALGFAFNVQYSLSQVLALLGWGLPPVEAGVEFWLVLGVPVLVLLVGNVYCGYLCPFGLLQEGVGDLRPATLDTSPGKVPWRRARLVKYGVLFVLVVVFACTFDRRVASTDPLVMAFSGGRGPWLALAVLALLVLGLFYPRFWCRNLCPAGAFLALLNGVRLWRRAAPPVVPARCCYGVVSGHDLDCLCCDRCRCAGPPPVADRARGRDGVFLAIVALAAVVLVGGGLARFRAERAVERAGIGALVGGGKARDADMGRLRGLIERGALSDHEARHYKKRD